MRLKKKQWWIETANTNSEQPNKIEDEKAVKMKYEINYRQLKPM